MTSARISETAEQAGDDEASDSQDGPGGQEGPAGQDEAGRYTVRSVARAMRLVQIVADGPPEGLTLSDLARALGVSKSTTLALARTLTSFGMLRDGRPGPRYTLGTAAIRLGDIARGQLPLGDLSRPLLTELADLTKMTSRLAICDDGFPVFIERVDGPGSVRFHTPLGQREMPHASAAGKAILATMTEQQVRDLCARPACGGGRVIRSPMWRPCWRIWPRCAATASPSTTRKMPRASSAWARPSSATTELSRGAVSVTGIKGDLPAWRVNELGQAVRRAADRVSEMLGGPRYADRDRAGSERENE